MPFDLGLVSPSILTEEKFSINRYEGNMSLSQITEPPSMCSILSSCATSCQTKADTHTPRALHPGCKGGSPRKRSEKKVSDSPLISKPEMYISNGCSRPPGVAFLLS